MSEPHSVTPDLGLGRAAFYPDLESLRGIAAATVCVFHVINLQYAPGAQFVPFDAPSGISPSVALAWVLRAAANGHAAVIFFFVLSGYVLRLSLARRGHGSGIRPWHFICTRLFRLYPAIFVALTLYVGLFWMTGWTHSTFGAESFRTAHILRNFLLVEIGIIPPMWTLQLELLALPLILLGFALDRRFGLPALAVLCGITIVLSFDGRWNTALQPVIMTLAPMHAFVIGMLVPTAGPLLRRLTTGWATALFGLSVVLLLAVGVEIGTLNEWGLLLTSILSSALIAFCAYGPPMAARTWLLRPGMRLLGRVSYSFYLLHGIAVYAAAAVAPRLAPVIAAGVPPPIVGALLAAIAVLLTIPGAILLHRFVELPGIVLGRRVFDLIDRRQASTVGKSIRSTG